MTAPLNSVIEIAQARSALLTARRLKPLRDQRLFTPSEHETRVVFSDLNLVAIFRPAAADPSVVHVRTVAGRAEDEVMAFFERHEVAAFYRRLLVAGYRKEEV